LLTLAVSVIALFLLAVSGGAIAAEFLTSVDALEIYNHQDVLEIYASEVLKTAVIETYDEISDDKSYISDSPVCIIGNEKTFCELNKNLNTEFLEKAKIKFFDNFDIEEIKTTFKEKKIDVVINPKDISLAFNDAFELQIENVTFILTKTNPAEEADFISRYKFNIKKKIDFEDVKLDSFETIHKEALDCSSESVDKFDSCFDSDNFNLNVNEKTITDQDFYEVNLVSKEEFFIKSKQFEEALDLPELTPEPELINIKVNFLIARDSTI
jgi:hypothetical protein